MVIELIAPITGVIAVLFALFLSIKILKMDSGTKDMREIANAIKEGAMAYLNRQYKTIAVFVVILFFVLAFFINLETGITFVIGAFLSALAGYIGMNISIRANLKTANAAKKSLDSALKVAFRGGAVTGLSVTGLSLLGVSLLYIIYKDPLLIIGFGFGASLICLFARVGGGIFTKAADVGADLVGKVEKGIPEDDPRNPAVIADLVGDNVGDCAGMGADLFETYAATILGAMLLGSFFYPGEAKGVIYPIILGAVGVFASLIGTFFIKKVKRGIMASLYRGIIVSGIISVIGFYFVTDYIMGDINLFYASLVGLSITFLINIVTDYYTSKKYAPVKSIVEASKTGPGTNIITGIAVGLKSTAIPVIGICIGILVSYWLGGLYGIGIAVMGMLSLTGMIVTLDAYGPITDNAGGIVEMVGLDSKVRDITDQLDAVGNTTKAVTKGFAIGSAAFATLALFVAYTKEIEAARLAIGITSPLILAINAPIIIVGLFIGALLPFLFSAFCMKAVGMAAHDVVNEVRRQFKEIKGIMQRKAKPDYAKCVDIVTQAALKKMIVPGLIAIVSPIFVGFLLGPEALGALLIGSIVSGLMLAILMANSGAAWDNAKKYLALIGKKGSPAHKAAVIGDTVGDPFKDTAGPSLDVLIKLMNIIAIIFARLFVR